MSDNRAMKLLEAFSGVEEDLLERCESAVVGAAEEKFGEKTTESLETGEQGKIISLADKLKKNLKKQVKLHMMKYLRFVKENASYVELVKI